MYKDVHFGIDFVRSGERRTGCKATYVGHNGSTAPHINSCCRALLVLGPRYCCLCYVPALSRLQHGEPRASPEYGRTLLRSFPRAIHPAIKCSRVTTVPDAADAENPRFCCASARCCGAACGGAAAHRSIPQSQPGGTQVDPYYWEEGGDPNVDWWAKIRHTLHFGGVKAIEGAEAVGEVRAQSGSSLARLFYFSTSKRAVVRASGADGRVEGRNTGQHYLVLVNVLALLKKSVERKRARPIFSQRASSVLPPVVVVAPPFAVMALWTGNPQRYRLLLFLRARDLCSLWLR